MKDLLLDEKNDLQIENGDLVFGDSDVQHQQLLLQSNKGDWKENPTIGVNINDWLKNEEPGGLLGEIKKEFERDGMSVHSIDISGDGKLDIDATY